MLRYGAETLLKYRLQALKPTATTVRIRSVCKRYVIDANWRYTITKNTYLLGSLIQYENHLGLAKHGISYEYENAISYAFTVKNKGHTIMSGDIYNLRINGDIQLRVNIDYDWKFKIKKNEYSYKIQSRNQNSARVKVKKVPYVKRFDISFKPNMFVYELVKDILIYTNNFTNDDYLL